MTGSNSRVGVDAISGPDGSICVLAIDHRDSMRRFVSPRSPDSVDPRSITELKMDVVRALIDQATGVMLEPEFSIPQVLDAELVPEQVGVIAALEAQGYLSDPAVAITSVLPGWSPTLARKAGASMVKLLLPYRPGSSTASQQETVAQQVIADSAAAGISLVLEPMLWGSTDPVEHAALVVQSVHRFAPMGAGLLKIPMPGDGVTDVAVCAAACAEITDVCESFGIPWAVLSGGGTFERFEHQLNIAMSEGCSGFMVGRALWGEAALAPPHLRQQLLADVVAPRFARLNEIASNHKRA